MILMSYKFTDKGSKYSSFWRSSFDTKSIFDDFDSSEDKPKKKGKDVIALAAHRRAIANFVRICTSIGMTFGPNRVVCNDW